MVVEVENFDFHLLPEFDGITQYLFMFSRALRRILINFFLFRAYQLFFCKRSWRAVRRKKNNEHWNLLLI